MSFRLTAQLPLNEFVIFPWDVVADLIPAAKASISDDEDTCLAFAKIFVRSKGKPSESWLLLRQNLLEGMVHKDMCEAKLWESTDVPSKFLFQLICLGYVPRHHCARVRELAHITFSGRFDSIL